MSADASLRHDLGLAFHLQDDILDIDGNEKEFGKVIGRDIMEGKRTFLLSTALERVKGADRRIIDSVMKRRCTRKEEIGRVRKIYERKGVIADARKRWNATRERLSAR